MYRHSLLSDAQREAIETAHFDLDDREVARYWTLSEPDLLRIDRRRRDANRFGFAVQLCLLRFPGWPPKRRDRVPLALLRYVGEQLKIQADNIEEYFRRQPTRSDHLQEIINLYGFRSYDQQIGAEITAWMKAQAHRWHTPAGLLMALLEELRRRRVILPALSLLEHMAWRAHRQVEEEALAKLSDSLQPLQRSELDDLLLPAIDVADRTLMWLRRPIGAAGAKGMLDLMDRLEFICALELEPSSAEGVSPLLLRQLAGRGARHTLQHLREYKPRKRFGILAAFLLQSAPNLTDELIEMFMRLVGRWFNRADQRRWETFQNNGRHINQKLHEFIILGRGLMEAHAKNLSPQEAIESTFGWKELAASIGETEKLAAPLDFSNLEELSSQYSQARQYAPRFLSALEFKAIPRRRSLLQAVETLRNLNQNEQSALPQDAPREFFPDAGGRTYSRATKWIELTMNFACSVS
jgi:Domain of unknown function (DUF4158)